MSSFAILWMIRALLLSIEARAGTEDPGEDFRTMHRERAIPEATAIDGTRTRVFLARSKARPPGARLVSWM